MSARVELVKIELNEIYNLLNDSFEYVNIAVLKSDNRFKKIIELIMEIKGQSVLLNRLIIKIKWKIIYNIYFI